eukprot:c4852_g1_i1.p1 GENE.c4852_g1_i1~~c4852_g1_i1.p1  ORF type:complete len:450 (+),score=78.06 c4852_g1_i1:39-1352(+)
MSNLDGKEGLLSCVFRNFGKGYLAAAGVKGVIGILRKRATILDSPDLARWGTFCGLSLAILNGTLHIAEKPPKFLADASRAIPPHVRESLYYYRALVAGTLSGLSVFVLPPDLQSDVSIFVAVNALEVQGKLATNRKWVPELPNWDVLLMMLGTAEMMWAVVFQPSSLAAGHRGFLVKHAQLHPTQIESIRRMQLGLPLDLEQLNKFLAKHNLSGFTDPFVYNTHQESVWNHIAHLNRSVIGHTLQFFVNSASQALRVYVPLYSLTSLIFSFRNLLKSPIDSIRKIAENIIRSTIFFACYCVVGNGSMRWLRKIGFTHKVMGSWGQLMVAMSGFVAGLLLVLEKPSRRVELALFICRQAVHSALNVVSPIQGSQMSLRSKISNLLFCLGLGHMMHAFVQHPEMIRHKSMLSKFVEVHQGHKVSSGEATAISSEKLFR